MEKHEETVKSEAGIIEIDYEAEKKLVRKIDRHIVPVIMLLYLFSFLDRVNIGNARLYGLESDLGLSGNQFQIATSVLFATYVPSEIPSNLVLKKFTPSRWISTIATLWGIIATLTGITHSFGSLIACRLLLGAVEGGLYPGLVVYLTLFYTKKELALRVGYLFVSAALAGACGGLLALAIGYMDGIAGLRAWRWILILEGIPTFCLGIACFFLLANDGDQAWYLKDDEKALLRLRRERQQGQTGSATQMHKKDVLLAFKDWKIWMFCIGQFGMDTMLYGYSTFLPTIIKSLKGWSAAQVQALTIPCYAAGAITYLLVARLSDKLQLRGVFTVCAGTISVIGYGILLSDSTSGAHYFGCFMVAIGLYVATGLPEAWLPLNQPRYGKRTTAVGMQLTIGNISGIMAPFLYESYEGPRYFTGHGTTLALVGMATMINAFMWWYLAQKNRRRSDGNEDGKVAGMTDEQIDELGDESPKFMYVI